MEKVEFKFTVGNSVINYIYEREEMLPGRSDAHVYMHALWGIQDYITSETSRYPRKKYSQIKGALVITEHRIRGSYSRHTSIETTTVDVENLEEWVKNELKVCRKGLK